MNYDDIKTLTKKKTVSVTLSLRRAANSDNPTIGKHFKANIATHFVGFSRSKDKYTFMIILRNAKGFPFNVDNVDEIYEYITWSPRMNCWFIGDGDYYVKLSMTSTKKRKSMYSAHVKTFAQIMGLSYKDAQKHPRTKETYLEMKTK